MLNIGEAITKSVDHSDILGVVEIAAHTITATILEQLPPGRFAWMIGEPVYRVHVSVRNDETGQVREYTASLTETQVVNLWRIPTYSS